MLHFFRGKKHTAVLAFLLLATSFLHFSFKSKHSLDKAEVVQNALELKHQIENLNQLSGQIRFQQVKEETLQNALSNTRLAYKKIEFLLEYYYPNYIEEHINGAPLLHIARNEGAASVLPPEGLQVLDELIYAEDAYEKYLEISAITQKLQNSYNQLYEGFLQKQILDIEIIEAARLQLVRVFTLGLTGFDTPGSLNAILEAQTSLQSMAKLVLPLCSENKSQIENYFLAAQTSLGLATKFENLDRLAIVRNTLNPLYGELLKTQNEQPDTRQFVAPRGWNAQSDDIFKANFLDPYFYTQLAQTEDSPELKDLGEKLFFDKKLSAQNKFSCATCHIPEKAFTDGEPKSLSFIDGKSVKRNSPTLVNAVFADRFFYDLRAFSLEQQAEHVIFNHLEFNTAYREILDKLKSDEQYTSAFKATFGKSEINRDKLSKALASYVLSIRGFESEFDKYMRGETEEIAPEVKRGYNIFMGKASCGTCHFAPTFAGLVPPLYQKNESEILGVLENPRAKEKRLDSDKGRVENNIDSEKAWIYTKSFKTVTVRNVKETGPYFHNGAYQSLEEVVDFYDAGGGLGYGLVVPNQTLAGDSLHLSTTEKTDLIAFMNSLSGY